MIASTDFGAPLESDDLTADGDRFVAGTDEMAIAISANPQRGMAIRTDGSALCVRPVGMSSASRSAAVTEDGGSVLFESTAEQTSAVVTPTDNGIETFNNIKSAEAPETVSWQVDLSGEQRLVPQADGSVAVVDPTPTAAELGLAAPDAPPAVVLADADQTDAGAGQAGPREGAAVDPIPPPVAVGEAVDATPPTSEATARADLSAALDDGARAVADKLEGRPGGGSTSAADVDAFNRQLASDAVRLPLERVLATIERPVSYDAAGAEVPSFLTVTGSTVTLHVQHRAGGYAYPIAADPVIAINADGTLTHCCVKIATANTGSYYGTWSIQSLPSYFLATTSAPTGCGQ